MTHKFAFLVLTLIVCCAHQSFAQFDYVRISRFAHSPEPPEPVPYPDQETCDDLTARKFCGAGPSGGKWAVVKVTPLPIPLPKKYDKKGNLCSPFSYARYSCREMLMNIDENKDDHSLTIDTFAYNNITLSTVHYTAVTKLTEQYYAIYQGKPSLMEEHFDDHSQKKIDPIPDVVLNDQGEMFAKVGKSEDDYWMIFQTCDSHAAWVLVKADIKAKDLAKLEPEYMAKLKALGIDYEHMVDVPVLDADGESFRQCLYNLDEIVGAPNF